MARDPAALQLRLLQTVVEVASERNSTLVMPVPVELLRFFDKMTPAGPAAGLSPSLADFGDAEVAEAKAAIEGHLSAAGPDAIPPVAAEAIPPVAAEAVPPAAAIDIPPVQAPDIKVPEINADGEQPDGRRRRLPGLPGRLRSGKGIHNGPHPLATALPALILATGADRGISRALRTCPSTPPGRDEGSLGLCCACLSGPQPL
jgi:hypothetical protein